MFFRGLLIFSTFRGRRRPEGLENDLERFTSPGAFWALGPLVGAILGNLGLKTQGVCDLFRGGGGGEPRIPSGKK